MIAQPQLVEGDPADGRSVGSIGVNIGGQSLRPAFDQGSEPDPARRAADCVGIGEADVLVKVVDRRKRADDPVGQRIDGRRGDDQPDIATGCGA